MSIDRSLSQFHHSFYQTYEALVDTCSRPEFWRQVKDEVCTPEMLRSIAFTIGTGFAGGLIGGAVERKILRTCGLRVFERLSFSQVASMALRREGFIRFAAHMTNTFLAAGLCEALGGHWSLRGNTAGLINFNSSHFMNWLAFPFFNNSIQSTTLRYVLQRLFGGAVFTAASHLQQGFERRVGWNPSESETTLSLTLSPRGRGERVPSPRAREAQGEGQIADLLREYLHNTVMDAGVHHGNQIAQVGIQVSARHLLRFARQVGRATLWSSLGCFVGMGPGAVMRAPTERKTYPSGIESLDLASVSREVFLEVTERAIASEDADERALGFTKRVLPLSLPGWDEAEIFPDFIVEALERETSVLGPPAVQEAAFQATARALSRLRESPEIFRRLLYSFTLELSDLPRLTAQRISLSEAIYKNPLFRGCKLTFESGLFEALEFITSDFVDRPESTQEARRLLSTFPAETLDLEHPKMLKRLWCYLFSCQVSCDHETAFSEGSPSLDLSRLRPDQWNAIVEHSIEELWTSESVATFYQKVIELLLREKRINAEQAERICSRIEERVQKDGVYGYLPLIPLLALLGYETKLGFRPGYTALGADSDELIILSPFIPENRRARNLLIERLSASLEGVKGDFLSAFQGVLFIPGFRFDESELAKILENPLFMNQLPTLLEMLVFNYDREEFFNEKNRTTRREDSIYYLEFLAQKMSLYNFDRFLGTIRGLRVSPQAKETFILNVVRNIRLAQECDVCVEQVAEFKALLQEMEDHSIVLKGSDAIWRGWVVEVKNAAFGILEKRLEEIPSKDAEPVEDRRTSVVENNPDPYAPAQEAAQRFAERYRLLPNGTIVLRKDADRIEAELIRRFELESPQTPPRPGIFERMRAGLRRFLTRDEEE
ncbi:MAG: hypothetical protein HQM15_02060 [Deltaproteobacteria bacterium]|nr:hypothetical protein [Deltaproteobacteria bacterium]